MSFEVRATYAPSADVAICELVGLGTHTGPLDELPPTGRRIALPGCNVVEVRDGKILREREYFDTGALMHQLGADAPAAAASR